MNFVIMSGYLLQDPIQRQSQDGKTYVTGRFGVSQGKDQDGEYKPSIIFDFSCFGYDANTMLLAKKGDLITVAGRMQQSTNVSQTNGQTYVNNRIIANNVFLNVKPQPINTQSATVNHYTVPAQPYAVPAQPYAVPNTPAQPAYNNTSTTIVNPYNDPFRS